MKFMIHRVLGNIVQVDDKHWSDDKDLRPATVAELVANGFGEFVDGVDAIYGSELPYMQPINVSNMSKQDLNRYVVDNNLAGSLAMNKPLVVLQATVARLIDDRNNAIEEANNKHVDENVDIEAMVVAVPNDAPQVAGVDAEADKVMAQQPLTVEQAEIQRRMATQGQNIASGNRSKKKASKKKRSKKPAPTATTKAEEKTPPPLPLDESGATSVPVD